MSKINCSICGKENEADTRLCSSCGYPINIRTFSSFRMGDYLSSLGALIKTWPKRPGCFNTNDETNGFLKKFLSVYYLRPENAVNRAIEAKIIADLDLWQEPALDVGCGDGVFTAILRGGVFAPRYDVFDEVDLSKKDIYDSVANKASDMFFAVEPCKVEAGIDIKPNIVQKADSTGLYKRTCVANATELPFEDGSFRTVFSNVLKNVQDIESALKEVSRVLMKDGRAILVLSSDRYRELLYYYPLADKTSDPCKKGKLLEKDRGRARYNIHCYDAKQWESLFSEAGLCLENAISYLTASTMRFWDTGLRDFSYKTISMMESLKGKNKKDSVKGKIVDYFDKKMRGFTNNEILGAGPHAKGGYFILTAIKK